MPLPALFYPLEPVKKALFGYPDVATQAKQPLHDAAAVNTTRLALVEVLRKEGLPLGTWSGGRTRWNRDRFGIEKTHALDALPDTAVCSNEATGMSTH